MKTVANFLSLYPTYQDFARAFIAGTLPIDLNGINKAGWQQIGDALNKETLFSDIAAELLALDKNSTPNDGFIKVSLGTGKYGYEITVKDEDGNPLSDVIVKGIATPAGGQCITNLEGKTLGSSTSTNISITSTGTITKTVVTALRKSTQKDSMSTSRNFRLSPNVISFDAFVCGGGGGYVSTVYNIANECFAFWRLLGALLHST